MKVKDKLSPSEALYGFAAWLTTRDEAVTFSSKHDASVAADLVDEFCKVNNLSAPDPDWATNLIHPSGEVVVAGRCQHEWGLTRESDFPGEDAHIWTCKLCKETEHTFGRFNEPPNA